MKNFHGCTALITGASAGLGSEFARQLAPRAQRLVLVARRLDRLETLKAELLHAHPQLEVYTFGLDLADDVAIDGFLRWLWNEGLRVNFLVNNAGLGDQGEFGTADWEKLARILDVNIVALTKLTHRLLPMLRNAAPAAILNVSSIVSLLPMPQIAVYAATKAYVSSLSEALRIELQGTGVSVTAVCPGPVETEFGQVSAREKRSMPSPGILELSPEKVVRCALHAVTANRARVIPGPLVAITMLALAAIPIAVMRLMLGVAARRMRERL